MALFLLAKDCAIIMAQLTSLTKEIVVLSLAVKTARPATKRACFGFEIDIANMIVGIPNVDGVELSFF